MLTLVTVLTLILSLTVIICRYVASAKMCHYAVSLYAIRR